MVTGSSSSSSISTRLDRMTSSETPSPDLQHHQPQSNLTTLAQAAHKHSLQAQQEAAAAASKNYTPLPRGEAPTCRESYFADTQSTQANAAVSDKGNSKPLEGLAASLQARVIASLKIKEEHEQRYLNLYPKY